MSADDEEEDVAEELSFPVSVSVSCGRVKEMKGTYEGDRSYDEHDKPEEENLEHHDVHDTHDGEDHPPEVRCRDAACVDGGVFEYVGGKEPD